jgi:hypothetical protein
MITITLNEICKYEPCEDGWVKLLKHLGKTQADDERFPYETIIDSNGLNDALWGLRCLPAEHHGWIRKYAVWCARQVQHLMTDKRSLDALDVAERYANGNATVEEWDAANVAASVAAKGVANVSAWDAAWAIANVAASVAARGTAETAASVAARAAARAAASVAARAAARAAARIAQTAKLREFCRNYDDAAEQRES